MSGDAAGDAETEAGGHAAGDDDGERNPEIPLVVETAIFLAMSGLESSIGTSLRCPAVTTQLASDRSCSPPSGRRACARRSGGSHLDRPGCSAVACRR